MVERPRRIKHNSLDKFLTMRFWKRIIEIIALLCETNYYVAYRTMDLWKAAKRQKGIVPYFLEGSAPKPLHLAWGATNAAFMIFLCSCCACVPLCANVFSPSCCCAFPWHVKRLLRSFSFHCFWLSTHHSSRICTFQPRHTRLLKRAVYSLNLRHGFVLNEAEKHSSNAYRRRNVNVIDLLSSVPSPSCDLKFTF